VPAEATRAHVQTESNGSEPDRGGEGQWAHGRGRHGMVGTRRSEGLNPRNSARFSIASRCRFRAGRSLVKKWPRPNVLAVSGGRNL